MKHITGDMFESLSAAQTMFLKALPKNGKVIVVEFAVSKDCNESVHAIFMEVMMVILNLGGKERTTVELYWLAKAACFAQAAVERHFGLLLELLSFIEVYAHNLICM
ncbi:(S)-scoulerine 9-O-methyltransferase-like [Tripterygium wilfordii]|uniref:(S)-scoulerine 9-O-methyltransferase-like n=1 Tax=Tripterygium wilfordii TaxID=458696 RepID=UPI0018F7F060|nr:(S)-scoulerine 9-O-methyltransferase-like [Tripterygium wilfordii]